MGSTTPDQLGPYTLLRQIGEGGMSRVYLAEGRPGHGRRVALKVVSPSLAMGDDQLISRFLSEATLGRLLKHPNVVSLWDFGEAAGLYYIALEYVDGLTLHAVMAACARHQIPIPVDVSLQLLLQAAHGVAAAHQAVDDDGRPLGLIHRDLKPANLLISRDGQLKVADFGVARAATNLDPTVASGVIKGTVRYMSPEQAWGQRDLDQRSDLFSLGAVAYELLAGRPLYDGDRPEALLRLAQDGHFTPVAEALGPGFEPRVIVEVLTRALALDREERYPDAGALAQGLAAGLAAMPHLTDVKAWLEPVFAAWEADRDAALADEGPPSAQPTDRHDREDGRPAGTLSPLLDLGLGGDDAGQMGDAGEDDDEATDPTPEARPLWTFEPKDRNVDLEEAAPPGPAHEGANAPGPLAQEQADGGEEAPVKNLKDLSRAGGKPPEGRAPAEPAPEEAPPQEGMYGSLWDDDEPFEPQDAPPPDPGIPMSSADAWASAAAPPPPEAPAPPPPPAAPRASTKRGLSPGAIGALILGTVGLGLALAALNWLGMRDADDYLDDAAEAARRGEVDAAARLYERALASGELDEDDHQAALRSLVELESRRGAWPDAARHAEALAQAPGATADDQLALARLLDKAQRYDNAAPVWVRVGSADGAPPQIRLEAASTLADRGSFKEAVAVYSALEGSAQTAADGALGLIDVAQRQGDDAQVGARLERALSARGEDPRFVAAAGRQALERGRIADAEARFQEALGLDPSSVDGLLGLADVQKSRGQLRDAQSTLQRAPASDVRASTALGLLLADDARRRNVSQVDAALVACTRGRDAAGDHPLVLDCDGMALMVQGDAERAAQMLDRALRIGGGIPRIWIHRIIYDLTQGDPVSALSTLKDARQRFPGRTDLKILEARVRLSRDDPDGAESLLASILREEPEHAEARAELAAVRAMEGRYSEAESLYREVITANPWDLNARYGLADALLGTGRGHEAKAQYEAIVARDPAQAPAWTRLAAIATVDEQPAEALSHLRRALDLGYPVQKIRDDPSFYALADLPAFRALLPD